MDQPQTIVVTTSHGFQKPTPAPQNIREFSTGLCGCMEDCGGCVCAMFCFPCYVCGIASRLGESCCVALLPGGMLGMRTKFRTLYGVQGSICSDWLCTSYCGQLTMCQLDREMKNCGL